MMLVADALGHQLGMGDTVAYVRRQASRIVIEEREITGIQLYGTGYILRLNQGSGRVQPHNVILLEEYNA